MGAQFRFAKGNGIGNAMAITVIEMNWFASEKGNGNATEAT